MKRGLFANDLIISASKVGCNLNSEDSSAKAAEYESFLDLYSLISFVLIFATFMYTQNQNNPSNETSEIERQRIEKP